MIIIRSDAHTYIPKVCMYTLYKNLYLYRREGIYESLLIKNVSSSISHKKNSGTLWLRDFVIPGLLDFSFFPCSTFIYETILIKFSINVNIKKTQIFYEIKFNLKGHSRSYKTTFLFQNLLFLWYISCVKSNVNKTSDE